MHKKLRFTTFCAALVVSAANAQTPPSADKIDMRDGFEAGNLLKSTALAPCWRPENVELDQRRNVREGRWAAQLTVKPASMAPTPPPKPPAGLPSALLKPPSGSCYDPADPSKPVPPDGTERAEIWERQDRRLPLGTEVWYGFSMYVGETVKPDDGQRLVIGQIKQSGDKSPFWAQRFTNRNFHVTVQQDGVNGGECRILVNWQYDPPPMPASVQEIGGVDQPCAQDVKIERFAPLPNPFGQWLDMVYRVKASPSGGGLLEIWADGKLLSRLTGRFGYRADADALQYFKFGPYRDIVDYETTAYFDAFARGRSYDAVYRGGRPMAKAARPSPK